MSIDLGSKPEDATHISPHNGLWIKYLGGGGGHYQFFKNGQWEMGFGCMSNSYLEISKPEPWTGEGLPPVGTVCEFAGFNPEETTFDDPAVGDKVTVIAHYLSGCVQVAAFTYNCAANLGSLHVAQGAHGCFRLVRTAEQIAAEERERDIKDIQSIGDVPIAIAERLYKAGYRKQVKL